MKAIIVLFALLALTAATVPHCITYQAAPHADLCYECESGYDQFNGGCVLTTCRTGLSGLNMDEFNCVFWSIVDGSTTKYVGAVNVTNFNVDPTCYYFEVLMIVGNQNWNYTSGTTYTWYSAAPAHTSYQFTVPHADVLAHNCPYATSSDGTNNYITYNCTFQHTIFFQGFTQTVYTFSTMIKINTGVQNSIALTVNKLTASNVCCSIYTTVTSALSFNAAFKGAASTVSTFQKNAQWFNQVHITDASYAVYYLWHVKATLGSTAFFYTLTPDSTDNTQAGDIFYAFTATMATNAEVTLTIQNTVHTTASRRQLQTGGSQLATTSTGSMNIQGSNSAIVNTFAAMLLVVLALFAF